MKEINQIKRQTPPELPKNATGRIDVRRVIAVPFTMGWEFIISSHGVANWLGDIGKKNLEQNVAFITTEGIEFNISIIELQSRIILTWKKSDWQINSLLEVTIIPSGNKTTICFQQDNLNDISQREKMSEYWQAVLDKIEKILTITYQQ